MRPRVNPPHAFVPFHGLRVPLIGVSQDEFLERCAGCGALFDLQQIYLTGTQILCHECKARLTAPAPTSPNVRPQ